MLGMRHKRGPSCSLGKGVAIRNDFKIPGARKWENEDGRKARAFSGVRLFGTIPLLRSMPGSRDAASPPRPASPQLPETPRPSVLGLPRGSGRARRGELTARALAGRQLQPPRRTAGARREGSTLFPGWFLHLGSASAARSPGGARSRRDLRWRSARGRVCDRPGP